MKRSKRGFSVVSSLLGFSLLGLSTIGLATYMGSFEEVKVSYAQSANVQFMHSELLSSMEKVFTMTNINTSTPSTSSTKKEYGLCSIVTDTNNNNTYARFKGKTICPIHLKASAINLASNYKDGSVERFKYFVEEGQSWEFASGKCDKGVQENSQDINGFADNFPDDAFHKCFKYQSETGADHVYARLIIEPQKMPLFKKVSSGSVLVDELAYKLRSVISTRRELESGEYSFSMSQSAKYLWAAEVLDCHICNSTECKLARFSSSAQGTAARHSKTCYHSMYAVKEKRNALTLIAEKTAARINKPSTSLVRQDSNYSGVCRYNLFKCGGVSERDKKDFDPTLNFRFLLNYDQPEDSSIREMDLQVTDGTITNTFKQGTLFTPADQKARVTRKKDGSLIAFSEGDWPLKAGGSEVKAFMADQNTSGSSMCKNICGGAVPSFYPKLKVKHGDSNCDGNSQCSKTESFTNRKIACSWCNAKSCHSFAPNTYKWQKPDSNPADDLIGECTLSSSSMSGLSDSSISVSSLSDQDKKCLKYDDSNSTYSLESCDDKMLSIEKWMDFAEESQLIGGKGSDDVWSDGVLSSLAAAYNTVPANQPSANPPINHSVQNLLETDQKLPMSDDSKKYEFLNYSQTPMMGHNLFAHYPMQRDASGMLHSGWFNVFYREEAEDISLTKEEKARWVYFYREPLRSIDFEDKDKVGRVPQQSGDPALPSGINREKFLGRVRPTRPVYMKMDQDFYPRGGGSDPLVLVHHVAFKGITFGQAQSFLCRNINAGSYAEAFVTTTASSGDGYQRCQALGSNWYFIPPDTKDLLVSALLAVAPNAPRYPFPNPFKFPDGIPFWKTCTTGTDENGQACNSQMRRWKLSYKYGDMSTTDYKQSFESDHEFFFNKERGVLKTPTAAALGGLKAYSSTPAPPPPITCGTGIYTDTTTIDYRVALGDAMGRVRGFSSGDCLKCVISKRSDWRTCIGSRTEAEIRGCMSRGLDPCTVVSNTVTVGGPIGEVFQHSANFRPNWPKILSGSYNPSSDPLETSNPTSLLFNMESSETAELARIQTALTQLDDDTNLNSHNANIGAVNYNGRIMTYRSLRKSSDLSEFNSKAVKLCRYSKDENHIDFHKALILTATPSHWPSTDNCADYTSSNSQSFLYSNAQGPDKMYYKISSSPGGGNLKNLTKKDFVEIRKGLRTIIPLLKFHKNKGIYVRNTDKFCRIWKREKKRRAVGNCLVKNYNSGTLSIGGVNYGLSVSQNARKANTCHPTGKNCSLASSHFQSGYDTIVRKKSEAETSKTAKETRRSQIPAEIARNRTTCNQACNDVCTSTTYTSNSSTEYRIAAGDALGQVRGFSAGQCLACSISARPAWQACIGTPRVDSRIPGCVGQGLDPCTVVSGTDSGTCTVTSCGTNTSCINAKTAACSRITTLTNERNRLNTEITNLTALIASLETQRTCAQSKLTAAKSKSSCITYVSNGSNFNKHTLSYSPSNGIVSCSTYITALPIAFDDNALDKKCWSVQKLNPQYSFSFDGVAGQIGIKGGGGQAWQWDADADCTSDSTKLHTLTARCGGKYKNLVNLNNGFCNDDSVNYTSQTCAIP